MNWNIKELVNEYRPPQDDDLLFTNDDPDLLTIKRIVYNLEPYNRTVLLMYCELGSMRALAKELDVSHSAVIKKMDQIKKEIFNKYFEEKANALNNKIKRELNGNST